MSDDESLLAPEMVARLARLTLLARKLASARRAGRRRTRRVGSGIETIDLRAYVAGDDTRRIAWHAYARLERLLVRLVADEAPLRLTLVVDQSASMGHGAPTKSRQAARIAAGFAAVALGGEDRVGVAGVRPVTGRAGLPRVLAALDRLAPVGNTDLPSAVRAVLEAAPGRGLCVIVSDFFEPHGVLAGAREARKHGHDVALVEVLAPFEVDPPDVDGLDLEDEETGELLEMPAAGTRERFLAALAAHRASIDEAARFLDAPVVRTTTAEPFETIVTRALTAGVLAGGRS
ncbi:MAG: DUF58 domain-containing protein [Labilithrix sp.]|nr:DUF58 domain-containing protein [Labilithrix sp.]MCW5817691.1 DUF58 domain-containing protein [Labilithrix sp.]